MGKDGRVTVIVIRVIRPLGDSAFQNAIGRRLGRVVTPGKRGRKPKADGRCVEEKEKG